MTFQSLIVILAFATWLALTIVAQFPEQRRRWIGKIDIVGMIPIWTFFAPNPGNSDYHLLYRYRIEGGSVTYWKELNLYSCKRLRAAIWHPEKRKNKALIDMVMDLVRLSKGSTNRALLISVPYIALLNLVSEQSRPILTQAVQFMVLETFGAGGRKSPLVGFISEFHRV